MEEEMEFFNKNAKKEDNSVELGEDETTNMAIKVPKPLFSAPTDCVITDIKFFKQDNTERDRKGNEYVPFFMKASFKEKSKENSLDFTENYRGGRFYTKDGKVSIYIGPASSMGKIKAICINSGIDPGNSVKTWKESLVGKVVQLQSIKVMFDGKDFNKNQILSIRK